MRGSEPPNAERKSARRADAKTAGRLDAGSSETISRFACCAVLVFGWYTTWRLRTPHANLWLLATLAQIATASAALLRREPLFSRGLNRWDEVMVWVGVALAARAFSL